MRKIVCYIVLLFLPSALCAQSVEDIMADVYQQVAEYGGDLENLTEELRELSTNKININQATADDLQRLRFLSDVQIDALLNYVNKHPMNDISELQLLPCLRDYEIRDLSYFLTAEPVMQQDKVYPREVFHFAKHETTLRLDARNIESYSPDPIYAQLRYRFNYRNQVMAGVTVQHSAGQSWSQIRYGGYVQLNHIAPHLKTLVLGNFEAQFGEGLVLGSAVHRGKSSYLMASSNGVEGIRKYSSVSDSYDYLHGAAATLTFGKVDLSVLYSLRKEKDSLLHHVVGLNATYRHDRFKVGLTALEQIYRTDSTQTVLGLNARYNLGRWDFFGEAATCYDASAAHRATLPRWGWGILAGARLTPLDGLGLLMLYRYYSPSFESRYAYSFAETSAVTDENGFYLGTEIRLVPRWRFSLYGDAFRFADVQYGIPYPSNGFDIMAQADYEPRETMNMFWKIRAKRKALKNTYSLRYQFNWNSGGWHLCSGLDGSLVKGDTTALTWGVSVFQDIHYTFRQVPITLQLRLQGFDIRQWDNRIYLYENDVLYGFSIPAVYGRGGRCYLNMRYRITDYLSLYFRVSETVYHPDWQSNHCTRTDLHLLLRAFL